MALSLTLATLESRKTQVITNTKRKAVSLGKQVGGLLSKLQKLGGFIWGAIGRFLPPLSFESIWDMMVDGYFELKQFDWNQLDSDIEKQIETNNKRLLDVAAESLGEQLGFNTVRLASSFAGKMGGKKKANPTKIPVLRGEIAVRLAEESSDELTSSVRRFLGVGARTMASNTFLSSVLYLRKNELFGFDSITKPLKNGSIATKIEEKIEKLPKNWQSIAENLIEGFEEGIIEAVYVVASTIDDHVSAARYARRAADGPMRTIDVKFDPQSDETISFTGPQLQVEEAIRQAESTHQFVQNRDLGILVGQSIEEQIKPQPQLRRLKILYYNRERKPWAPKGDRPIRAEISIPDCKQGLTAQELRAKIPRHSTGPIYCSLQLSSGRQMTGWFSSEAEGRRTLTTLAELSTSDVVPGTLRASQALDSGPRRKKIAKLYPCYASLVYPRNRNRMDNKDDKPQTLELWRDSESSNRKALR